MAINWATDPVTRHALPHIALTRLPPNGNIRGAITCTKPLSAWCHFIGNRTLPCVDTHCPGCAANRRRIRECYVSLWTVAPSRHIITVLTPAAELNLCDGLPNPENSRGHIITINREGKRANGRVRCTVSGEMAISSHLPTAPDLKAHLHLIWGLTPELLTVEHPLFDVREQFTIPIEEGDGARLRKAK